jgi:CheY-like chemotaxis protein
VIDGALKGLRVLVVDDDFRNIFAMTALLERAHATVTAAESGAEAVATLANGSEFDVVLMDIMMPVMDGYDTIRAIRKLSGCEVLPILAVTGKAATGERERCVAAGADDYIPKPVDTAELLATLTPWLPVAATALVTT